MLFQWDTDKAKRNLKKHGISFDEAVTVFYDSMAATFDDPDHSQSEERFITVGFSVQGNLLVVVHADKGDTIRIISARSATANERKRHEG